jgi:surfeit locus 1 family protein
MTAAVRRPAPWRSLHWSLALAALVLFTVFAALGTWQLQRRAWKLDLIERVNQRVSAPAAEAPTLPDWPRVNAANDEYRHVRLTGRFLGGLDAQVQAVTVIGSGFWLLSPLQLADDSVVWVNRGFVPPGWVPAASNASAPGGEQRVTVTGLLRLSEPGGGFLRSNEPAAGRWFSRDVAALSGAHGLRRAAPYFVDADAAPAGSPPEPQAPVGGLTVIAFHNSHLVYALTWYALALMVAGAAIGVALQNTRHDDLPRSADAADAADAAG